MRLMALQSLLGALLLLVAALWPREGGPVLVIMPVNEEPAWLFAAESWQLGRLSEAWGVRFAWLHPARGNASVSEITSSLASFAHLVVRARANAGCP